MFLVVHTCYYLLLKQIWGWGEWLFHRYLDLKFKVVDRQTWRNRVEASMDVWTPSFCSVGACVCLCECVPPHRASLQRYNAAYCRVSIVHLNSKGQLGRGLYVRRKALMWYSICLREEFWVLHTHTVLIFCFAGPERCLITCGTQVFNWS